MFRSKSRRVLDNPPNKERRSRDRLPVQVGVFCQNAQGENELWWYGRVIDISRGGIKLLSQHHFEPSKVIRISKADGEKSSEFLEAQVVRAQRSPGAEWTLGCAFTKELSQVELLKWFGSLGWFLPFGDTQVTGAVKAATEGEVTEDSHWLIDVYQADSLLAFARRLAARTMQAQDQQEEACYATATILLAAAAVEALQAEFAQDTNGAGHLEPENPRSRTCSTRANKASAAWVVARLEEFARLVGCSHANLASGGSPAIVQSR